VLLLLLWWWWCLDKLTSEQYVVLLNTLNPYDKQRAKRVLLELDFQPDHKMDFQEFAAIHQNYPTLLYPAFKFQLRYVDR
jgi:hypothetical protein